MAFISKVGNLLKQNLNSRLSTSNPSLFQVIRCMSSSKIFIGGLSYSTDDMSLKEAFTSYGEVIETKIIMDRETGRSRGFGFVSFTSTEEATSAIQAMDGKDLHGRRVTVNYAAERAGGFHSEGGYGNSGGYGGDNSGGYGGSGGGYDNSGGYGNSGGSAYGDGVNGYQGNTGGNGYQGNTGGGFYSASGGGNYGGSGNDTFGTPSGGGGAAADGINNSSSGGFVDSNRELNGSSNQYNNNEAGSQGAQGSANDLPWEATNK